MLFVWPVCSCSSGSALIWPVRPCVNYCVQLVQTSPNLPKSFWRVHILHNQGTWVHTLPSDINAQPVRLWTVSQARTHTPSFQNGTWKAKSSAISGGPFSYLPVWVTSFLFSLPPSCKRTPMGLPTSCHVGLLMGMDEGARESRGMSTSLSSQPSKTEWLWWSPEKGLVRAVGWCAAPQSDWRNRP